MQTTQSFADAMLNAALSAVNGGTLVIKSESGVILASMPVKFFRNGSVIAMSEPATVTAVGSGASSRWSLSKGGKEMMRGLVSEDMEMLNPNIIKGGRFTLHKFNIKVNS